MSIPFLKYPGGKRNIIDTLKKYYPKKFKNFYEPFVGGGAVFFDIEKQNKIIINDINKNISNSYKNLKKNCDEIINELDLISKKFKSLNNIKREEFYYKIRDEFNNLISNKNYGVKNTVLLIFLNRTCFNGIYRENSKGFFNVPFGKHSHDPQKDTIVRRDILTKASKKLKGVSIYSSDFEKILKRGKKGDFFYIDPPYMPLSKTSHFTMYDKSGFDKKAQLRLRIAIEELNEKGCFVLFNNSDQPFIREIYSNNIIFNNKKFKIYVAKANRAVNSKATGRGKINELIITNY